MSQNKIQSLLISHLNKHGHIQLILPDGMMLEIGVDQENGNGELVIKDDYCWVIASREERIASIDSYNLGVQFPDDKKTLVFEDNYEDENGEKIKRLEVI
jgi:hypothetical protein